MKIGTVILRWDLVVVSAKHRCFGYKRIICHRFTYFSAKMAVLNAQTHRHCTVDVSLVVSPEYNKTTNPANRYDGTKSPNPGVCFTNNDGLSDWATDHPGIDK